MPTATHLRNLTAATQGEAVGASDGEAGDDGLRSPRAGQRRH